jgi:hypothetical protein
MGMSLSEKMGPKILKARDKTEGKMRRERERETHIDRVI